MSATALQALIFDVDGTLADTESVHLAAFNHAFKEMGMSWVWSEALYTELLNISGGKERIFHYWKSIHPEVRELGSGALNDTVNRLHELKTAAYESAVTEGAVNLRPGVLQLMEEACQANMQLAIATTTSPVNIAALLSRAIGPDWRTWFVAIGDASTAPIKKPHPQVYLQMLAALKLSADQCIAFEDSSNGLRSATAAGIATVISPTHFTQMHDFRDALCVAQDLAQLDLASLRRLHGQRPQRLPSIS